MIMLKTCFTLFLCVFTNLHSRDLAEEMQPLLAHTADRANSNTRQEITHIIMQDLPNELPDIFPKLGTAYRDQLVSYAFELSINQGRINILRQLLTKYAFTHWQEDNRIALAKHVVKENQCNCLDVLLKNGCPNTHALLAYAVQQQKPACVKTLLEHAQSTFDDTQFQGYIGDQTQLLQMLRDSSGSFGSLIDENDVKIYKHLAAVGVHEHGHCTFFCVTCLLPCISDERADSCAQGSCALL